MIGQLLMTHGTHVGYFYTWWRGDNLPDLGPFPDLEVMHSSDTSLLAHLAGLPESEIQARIQNGNHPYLATLNGVPAAFGWSAWHRMEIGELGVDLELPDGDHYLWDFVTLPDFRGRGIYPHMLQAIIRAEVTVTERFWIGHDLDNIASARGIEKAGLPVIGEVWVRDGEPIFIGRKPRTRAEMAARLLSLPFEMR
jgi:GNAT superfamily N-acetyltransferase